MDSKRVFISAEHGLAIVYFMQSDVVSTLIENGVEVILLTDDALQEPLTQRFGRQGLTIEGLRLERARQYSQTHSPNAQYWIHFLRRVGASNRINTEAMDSAINQIEAEAVGKRRGMVKLAKMAVSLLRRSRTARQILVRSQMRYAPDLYSDLFEKYQPQAVISNTLGWRLDRYLLRQAAQRGVTTAAGIVGWDNPSSYSLSGAPVDYVTCWSDLQKQELVQGSDWDPSRVNIGGIPSYDGYFRKEWLIDRDEYFRMHGLDPQRKLLSYACSFISFSPNYQNVEALAKLVSDDTLPEPCQLLIRLHPTHFQNDPLFAAEANRIRQLAQTYNHVHLVEPVPLGGELGYYSGEDMPEKTSMMAHSDIFLTVYSTMVVEAAIHERPIVSVCIDAAGWDPPQKNRFLLPLSRIGDWPTHQRFRQAGAGRVALTPEELRQQVAFYLENPLADQENRRKFIRNEVTFTDGSAGKRTAEYFLSLLDKKK